MDRARRSVVAGLSLLPFAVAGGTAWLSPADARERGIALTTLSPAEAALLERVGDILLPGAAAAGLSHFVDHHLGVPPAESLLMLRYLDVPPPYAEFYRAGLAALAAHAQARLDAANAQARLDAASGQARLDAEMVGALMQASPDGWQGPPSPFLMFVLRSDAVDVVYGTRDGLAKLGLPVMAHVEPETEW